MAKATFQFMLRMVAAKKADFLTQQAAKIGPWPARGLEAKDSQQRLPSFCEQTGEHQPLGLFWIF